MSKPFEVAEDDTAMIDALELSFAQFLQAYSRVTGINYFALMLMVFDISSGALGHADKDATLSLMDATIKMTKAGKNLPAQVDRRRKAQTAILERADFLASEPKGSA